MTVLSVDDKLGNPRKDFCSENTQASTVYKCKCHCYMRGIRCTTPEVLSDRT